MFLLNGFFSVYLSCQSISTPAGMIYVTVLIRFVLQFIVIAKYCDDSFDYFKFRL